jgi:hypothetical protein
MLLIALDFSPVAPAAAHEPAAPPSTRVRESPSLTSHLPRVIVDCDDCGAGPPPKRMGTLRKLLNRLSGEGMWLRTQSP